MKKLLILVSVFLMAFINASLSENGPASLPAYAYQGSEKYVGAVCQYILNVENTSCVPDEAAIPCIVILETADSDPEDVRLWGDFAVFNYKLVNTTLMCQSGGSFLGMTRLKPVGDSWKVVSVDKVGDGDDYSADVKRIFGLRDGLLERFEAHSNMMDAAQVQSVSDYVNWNGLAVTQLQNFGWNPVPLINAPDTPEDAQIVHFDSVLGYSIDYDCSPRLSVVKWT